MMKNNQMLTIFTDFTELIPIEEASLVGGNRGSNRGGDANGGCGGRGGNGGRGGDTVVIIGGDNTGDITLSGNGAGGAGGAGGIGGTGGAGGTGGRGGGNLVWLVAILGNIYR